MKDVAAILLATFLTVSFALTGCGTSCSDSCDKMLSCDYQVTRLEGNCQYFCDDISDCMTKCDTDQDCDLWIQCVSIECMYWF